jgi:Sulfotransferase family
MSGIADGPLQAPAPFVVGVARSGTTLLRLMLDSHPDLAIPAETHFLPPLIRRVNELERAGADTDELRAATLELIVGHPRFRDLGVAADALEAHLAALQEIDAGAAARAVHLVHAADQGKPRWGDKTPRYLRRMRPLWEALPEARFVHLVRDGRDVAVSLAQVSWGTADPAEAARLWKDGIEGGRNHLKWVPAECYVELRYEELVAEPERVLRRAAEFLELPWDRSMLAYHEHAHERLEPILRDFVSGSGRRITAEQRRRQHSGLDAPPSAEGVGRWRRELSRSDVRRFERVAGDLLEELSYPLS